MPTARPPRTMLDSGAFSAWNSGQEIDIDALTEETKNPYWHESVALDVIGDHLLSLRNARYMRLNGSHAMPVFHFGEPWTLLKTYCEEFPKVGLSCLFGEPRRESFRFLDQCFARAWPHRFHSFGWTGEDVLMRFPFESADSCSWNIKPARYGQWASVGGRRLGIRGTRDMRAEIEPYLDLQKKLEFVWKKELASLPNTSASRGTRPPASST
jgi:hypothetical protein